MKISTPKRISAHFKKATHVAFFLSLSERKEQFPAIRGEACGDTFAEPMAPMSVYFSCFCKKRYQKKCAAPKPRGRRVADKAERIRRLPSSKTSPHGGFGFSILQKQNRPTKTAKIRRVQTGSERVPSKAKFYHHRRADCLTPMFCRPRRYVDLSKLARQQRHESPNIKNRFSVLFAPFSCALQEKGGRSRDARGSARREKFRAFFQNIPQTD